MAGKVKGKEKDSELEIALYSEPATQGDLVDLRGYTEKELENIRKEIDIAVNNALKKYNVRIKQHILDSDNAVEDAIGQLVIKQAKELRAYCRQYVTELARGMKKTLSGQPLTKEDARPSIRNAVKKFAAGISNYFDKNAEEKITKKITENNTTLDDKFLNTDEVTELAYLLVSDFFNDVYFAVKQEVPMVGVKVAHTLYDGSGKPISGEELDFNTNYSKMVLKLRDSQFIPEKQGIKALVSYKLNNKDGHICDVIIGGQVAYDPVKKETRISMYAPDLKGEITQLNNDREPDKQIPITDDLYLTLSGISVFGGEFKPGDFDKMVDQKINAYRKKKADELKEKEETNTQGVK